MANLNSILPNNVQKRQQRGYSKEIAKETFGTPEIRARVASDVHAVNVWDSEKRQQTDNIDHQYVYLEFPEGDPFKLKLQADANLNGIKFADSVETVGLEVCNFYNYSTHKRETYFRAKSVRKVEKL